MLDVLTRDEEICNLTKINCDLKEVICKYKVTYETSKARIADKTTIERLMKEVTFLQRPLIQIAFADVTFNKAAMPQDISDREDFYKDSSNKTSGRDNKSGWYDIHQKHVNLSLNSKTILVLIGDSIVAGLSRYANIWQTFFKTFSGSWE